MDIVGSFPSRGRQKRLSLWNSLIVKEGNQNKEQNEKQAEKRKKTQPNKKQRKKGMEAEIKKKKCARL
jgi:hypothetical protein